MGFSQRVWESAYSAIEAIKLHPFNLELADGSLDRKRFVNYIEQDVVYLQSYARCLAMLAGKVPLDCMRQFLVYAETCLVVEQEVLHQHFTGLHVDEVSLAPATLGYNSYLLQSCYHQPIEVAVAAILPCFWVYREVGRFVAGCSVVANPYQRWIDTYTAEDFSVAVDEVICFFDSLAKHASGEMRDRMNKAFYEGVCFEWHFWDDSYHLRTFDPVRISEL